MKKLLKENLKIIILMLITSVVTSVTSIFAYSLIANNVGYTPHDTTWNVDNVEAALNNLNLRTKELSTHYSTEEQVVGEWIDGKPIYQKTFNVGSMNSSGKVINDAVPEDYDAIVNVFGIAHNVSYKQWAHIPSAHQTSVAYNIRITINDENSSPARSIEVIPGGSYGTFDYVVVTVQYTKKTD